MRRNTESDLERRDMTDEQLQSHVEALLDDEERLSLMDGFADAFVGLGRAYGKPVGVYSKRKIIDILTQGGETEEEAEEYYQYNIAGAYIGNTTPVIIDDMEDPVRVLTSLEWESLADRLVAIVESIGNMTDEAQRLIAEYRVLKQ